MGESGHDGGMAGKDRLGIFESRISLATLGWQGALAVSGFALPAWAVRATDAFAAYSPASWVAAGFAGLIFVVIGYAIYAWAAAKRVRSKYDKRMLAMGGAIDPLDKTFERKRIYLNEFCLPSLPLIEDKTFIDCEIVGPANVIFVAGNNITQARYPICDAVLLHPDVIANNGYLFKDCRFNRCSFSRVTYLVPMSEYYMFRDFSLVRWITPHPDMVATAEQPPLSATAEALASPRQQDTVEETPR